MAKLLSKSGYPIKKIKRIKLTGKTGSERVKTVTVYHSNGKYNMTSHKFRMAMGTQIIRSTNFSARISGGYAYFKGHGWGHGVGMCQWGAKGMAEAGWNYKKILKHYYRGSKIKDNYGYEE